MAESIEEPIDTNAPPTSGLDESQKLALLFRVVTDIASDVTTASEFHQRCLSCIRLAEWIDKNHSVPWSKLWQLGCTLPGVNLTPASFRSLQQRAERNFFSNFIRERSYLDEKEIAEESGIMRERQLRSLQYLNISRAQGYAEFAAFLQQLSQFYRQLTVTYAEPYRWVLRFDPEWIDREHHMLLERFGRDGRFELLTQTKDPLLYGPFIAALYDKGRREEGLTPINLERRALGFLKHFMSTQSE